MLFRSPADDLVSAQRILPVGQIQTSVARMEVFSKGKLRDVQCARLDVHDLGREGRLKLGTRGCLLGTLIYRRDIANNAPDRITVRVIASERHPQNVGLFLVQTREVGGDSNEVLSPGRPELF
jgi:hypothetical protein